MNIQLYNYGQWTNMKLDVSSAATWNDINKAIARKESPSEDPEATEWKPVFETTTPSGVRICEMATPSGDHCICVIDTINGKEH